MGGTHLGDEFWHAACGPPTPPAPPLPPSITSRPVKIHVRQIKISQSFGGARFLGGVFREEFRGELNNCRAVKRENQQLRRAEAV